MKIDKVFVGCLPGKSTGGLTLAHQLCYELIALGYNAIMYYYLYKGGDPVHANYKKYNLPYSFKLEDAANNVVVAPETYVNLLRKVKKSKRVIWWMSVDNYFKVLKTRRFIVEDFLGLRRFDICDKKIIHFAQSQYAIDFLKKKNISENCIHYLSDYLDSAFISKSVENNLEQGKYDYVLYNPQKGFEFTEKLINYLPNVKWKPLINLTPEQMADLLKKSKLYIDFGNHPGKDRIPREAAISGCCIIVGKRGSAKFFEDVRIPENYKFEDSVENIPQIATLIEDILNNYEKYSKSFEQYKQMIFSEELQFKNDVKNIFENII